jgi:hypothetical protein
MDWRERLGSRQKLECSDGSSRKSGLDLSVREEEGQKLRRDETRREESKGLSNPLKQTRNNRPQKPRD